MAIRCNPNTAVCYWQRQQCNLQYSFTCAC